MPTFLQNPPLRPILAVIAMCLLVSAYLRLTLGFSGPYMDEADYLFVGRIYLEGRDWASQTYIFGSDIPLYILGFFDSLGGYMAARVGSALLGILSLFFFFKFSQHLFKSTTPAIFSVLVLALAAPHIFISKFATYDIICYTFFTAALWAGMRSIRTNSFKTLLLASTLFCLAFLSKYIAIAYAPFFFAILFFKNKRHAVWSAVIVGAVAGIYILANSAELTMLWQNHVVGSHAPKSSLAQVISYILSYTAVLYSMYAIGVFFKKQFGFSRRMLVSMGVLSLPLIAYHVRSLDLISAFKHMIFPATFLAPVAGWMISTLLKTNFQPYFLKRLPYFILPVFTIIAVFQTRNMENSFPDTRKMIAFLSNKIKPETKVMSEDAYLFRYYFYPKMPMNHFAETGYHDNNLDGKFEEQDVIDAIWDGKFDYVFLTGQITPELTQKLREGVLPNSYIRIYSENFKNSEVMRRNAGGRMEIYGLKNGLIRK
ncbi:MAG TPA: glycosyltransferase family 39 protein [Patescibacteria group bacterium]|nr:glycosyltransferase family 39 protein [Patescibacteria group bacterium]